MANGICRVLTAWTALAWTAISAPAMETLLVVRASKDFPRISEGDLLTLADGRLCVVYTRFTGGGDDESAADLVMQTAADVGRTSSPAENPVRNEGESDES